MEVAGGSVGDSGRNVQHVNQSSVLACSPLSRPGCFCMARWHDGSLCYHGNRAVVKYMCMRVLVIECDII